MEISLDENILMEEEQQQNASVPEAGDKEIAQPAKLVFNVNGEDWELTYTKTRVRYIEERLNRSVISILGNIYRQEMPTLKELYQLFAGGFRKVSGGYISFEQGEKIAEETIEIYGYTQLVNYIIYALDRDCPFLFRVS